MLKATLHLDETFDCGLRGELVQPFPTPGPEDEYEDIWNEAEQATRRECERVIEYWILHRHLPSEVDPDALFFLCRRFDQVSHFVQKMFLDQENTIFHHTGISLEDALRWLLVPWWADWGSMWASIEDFQKWEAETYPNS